MSENEQALTFECEGDTLVGVLHGVPVPAGRGVLIVVGGPQYRVGSHRQFVVLARDLAAHGVPVLRFDYRGMGDSAGDKRTFERVDADLRSAVDGFFERVPGLRDVVIWGLCDAASAALFYAQADARVSGIVLLNPWVHDEQGSARVYLRHYYGQRLFQSSFWKKIGSGEFSVRRAAEGLWKMAVAALRPSPANPHGDPPAGAGGLPDAGDEPFTARMEKGLHGFRGRVLLILSGNDFTAQEFKDLVAGSRRWGRQLGSKRVTRHDLPSANHTFSRREWRDQVARWTAEWVKSY
jgi:exosortase A-associated hydrolase 1